MNEVEQKHFKVIYGKVLGIPVGSAEPITAEGNRIFKKYFISFFIAVFLGVFATRFIENQGYQILIFMLCWCLAAFTGYLFIRQLKYTATFERQYFFKRN